MSYQNLKAELKRKGITYNDVAKLLDMSETAISLKINGKTELKIAEAILIRDEFFPSASLDYLLDREH